MNPEELIINDRYLVRPGQKFTAWGITLLFWGVLVYLWQPLISLIAWGLNVHLFQSHMIILGGYRALLDLLAFYGLVILIMVGSLLLWARIQQWRFRGHERRQAQPVASDAEIAAHFGVEPDHLQELRQARQLRVLLGADNRIARSEGGPSPLSTDLTPGSDH